jgi:hypothetical protein
MRREKLINLLMIIIEARTIKEFPWKMIPTSGKRPERTGKLMKNHRFRQENLGNQWNKETVLQTGGSWNSPGDFRPFPKRKNRNLAERHRKNPNIFRPGILLS